MGDRQLTLPRTGDRAPCRAPSRSTADRVANAWQHSTHSARRALLGACAASIVVAIWKSTIALAACGVLLALAALVDLRERRLPNRLLGLASAATLVGVAAAADIAVVSAALIGVVTAAAAVLIVHLSRGVGMGDVKMAGVIGMSVGANASRWFAPLAAVAIAAVAAATYGAIAHKQRVVLGPSLWLGWAVTLALNEMAWMP